MVNIVVVVCIAACWKKFALTRCFLVGPNSSLKHYQPKKHCSNLDRFHRRINFDNLPLGDVYDLKGDVLNTVKQMENKNEARRFVLFSVTRIPLLSFI